MKTATTETVTSLQPLSVDIVNAVLDRLIPAIMEEEAEYIKKLIKQGAIKPEVKEQETNSFSEFVTVNEASKLTGLHRVTLYNLIKKGKLKRYHVGGGKVKFNVNDLKTLYIEG